MSNSHLPSQEEAIKMLRESGCSPHVIKHCKAVAELAVHIANKCIENGVNVNAQLIHIGALLHDLGRSKTHTVHHVDVGVDIARSLNLPAAVISIIQRHVGGGITSEEALEIGLSNKDYMPKTLEEKIVAYADKLLEGTKIVPIEKAIQKLREKLGSDHPAINRVAVLHKEISTLCGMKK